MSTGLGDISCWVTSSPGVATAERVRARRLTHQEGQRLQQIVRCGKHGSIRVRRPTISWLRHGPVSTAGLHQWLASLGRRYRDRQKRTDPGVPDVTWMN
jgi:hypothetical protein